MSFDRAALADAVARRGRVARVVVAEVRGSAPREAGAAMLVWDGGQSGTIGGGALEFAAVERARKRLALSDEGSARPVGGREAPAHGGGAGAARWFPPGDLQRHALGPSLGQCCGGAVALLTEVFDEFALESIENETVFARPISTRTDMPLAVRRLRAQARAAGARPAPQIVDGWFVEPVTPTAAPVWVWGAGHVGRALVATLAPLPDFALTWLDTAPARFPNDIPSGVTALPALDLPAAMALAPDDAHHLILTYSHALDLDLCHAALRRGFASAGLIGSATKWARFRTRLQHLGHAPAQIDRITCPIGDPALGKHPQAIAVGVAALLLRQAGQNNNTDRESPLDRGTGPDRAAGA